MRPQGADGVLARDRSASVPTETISPDSTSRSGVPALRGEGSNYSLFKGFVVVTACRLLRPNGAERRPAALGLSQPPLARA
jgi:hypothetical protein